MSIPAQKSNKPVRDFEYVSGTNRFIPDMCPSCTKYTEAATDPETHISTPGPFCRIHASVVEKAEEIMNVFNLRKIDTDNPYKKKVESCEYQAKTEPRYVDYEKESPFAKKRHLSVADTPKKAKQAFYPGYREKLPKLLADMQLIIEKEGMKKLEGIMSLKAPTIRALIEGTKEPDNDTFPKYQTAVDGYLIYGYCGVCGNVIDREEKGYSNTTEYGHTHRDCYDWEKKEPIIRTEATAEIRTEAQHKEEQATMNQEAIEQVKDVAAEGSRYVTVPLTLIDANPYNPRTVFDPAALEELAKSIDKVGLIHRPLARIVNGRYQLAVGHRRWKAHELAGKAEMDIELRDYTDQEMAIIAISENQQRADVSPLDDARAYRILIDEFGMTQKQIAEQLGCTQPKVAQMLSLLDLNKEFQELIVSKELSPSVARSLATLDKEYQEMFNPEQVKRTTAKDMQIKVNYVKYVLDGLAKEMKADDSLQDKMAKFLYAKGFVQVKKTIRESMDYKSSHVDKLNGFAFSYGIGVVFPREQKYQALAQKLSGSDYYRIAVSMKEIPNIQEVLDEFLGMHCTADELEMLADTKVNTFYGDLSPSKPAETVKPEAAKPQETKEEREQRKAEIIENSPVEVIKTSKGSTKIERLLQIIQEHHRPAHEMTDRCYNCKFWNPEAKEYKERCKVPNFRELHMFTRFEAEGTDLFHCYEYSPKEEHIEEIKSDEMDIEHTMFELLLNQLEGLTRFQKLVPKTKGKSHRQILTMYRESDNKDKTYMIATISKLINTPEYARVNDRYILSPSGKKIPTNEKQIVGSEDI